MRDLPEVTPPPAGRYGLTGTTPAAEPGRQDFPQWPMTAAMASPFIPRVVA